MNAPFHMMLLWGFITIITRAFRRKETFITNIFQLLVAISTETKQCEAKLFSRGLEKESQQYICSSKQIFQPIQPTVLHKVTTTTVLSVIFIRHNCMNAGGAQ